MNLTTDDNEWIPPSPARLRAVVQPVRAAVAQPRPRTAVAISAAGVTLFALVGSAAPNHNTLTVPTTWRALPAMPDVLSQTVTIAAIALSCLGTLGMLSARRRGWSPDSRLLFLTGALAVLVVANLTPVGSSDTASYAAYGRIAALGGDPYLTSPAQLGGPYAQLVAVAWRDTTSVYGPVATWWQSAAACLGGERPWLTIWALMLANACVFLGTGYLLIRTADDPVTAGLLWVANPLLIGVLVGGGHLDTIVAALAVGAIHLARRTPRLRHDLLIGGLVGLACCVKISAALLGVALAWPLLRVRAWRRVSRQASVAALTIALLYSVYGLHALAPLSAASRMVSFPSLWMVFDWLGSELLGPDATATAIRLLWPGLMLVLAWALHRCTPAGSPPAVAVPFALAFAWVLTAPWSMPWYAALPWVPAVLCPQGRLTRYLVAATAALALVNNGGGHGWSA
ncbi:hypothetical protein EOT10_40260 [Streptomyces antnestii]|uniref:DUF2029 domain-containing protein n=1 Tax=Streptomyces antnestii TaxID=2494256 RepID=A0A3S2YMG1_9ACTN|nr:hypothetical protein [Streptomyces sp. San01]RVU14826.1 hypothetical protein EOT10_40260 [Streptomyces sp. San01]